MTRTMIPLVLLRPPSWCLILAWMMLMVPTLTTSLQLHCPSSSLSSSSTQLRFSNPIYYHPQQQQHVVLSQWKNTCHRRRRRSSSSNHHGIPTTTTTTTKMNMMDSRHTQHVVVVVDSNSNSQNNHQNNKYNTKIRVIGRFMQRRRENILSTKRRIQHWIQQAIGQTKFQEKQQQQQTGHLFSRHNENSMLLLKKNTWRAATLALLSIIFSLGLFQTRDHQLSSSQLLASSPQVMTTTTSVVRPNTKNQQHVVTLASSTSSSSSSSSSTQMGIETWIRGGQQQQQQQQQQKKHNHHSTSSSGIMAADAVVEVASRTTTRTFQEALKDLTAYLEGPKMDSLLLLLATALITPLCKRLGTSPILGFLTSGMLLGPNGLGWISGIHTTETLAELGIVFFLFEMGIELSFERLLQMRKDVFGLGLTQFLVTALCVAGIGKWFGGSVVGNGLALPANALVVLGGGLALSSSAFVLQLLKDKQQLATRFGKAAFGVLLFQDLAVVPLLVVTPILAGSGRGLASALGSAVIKAGMALGAIAFCGRVVLNPLFKMVAEAQSQEAFLGVILLTVLSMSFMTEGLGLSNTLGAFLAGVLLSETKYRYQVEADIAPFRGILLGLFFVTVGFEIDLKLIASNLPLVGSMVVGLLALKTFITLALSLAFGLSLSTSQQTGLILSQGGEFAFVAFGLARSLGILDQSTTKLMMTCVSLSMACTPFLASLGTQIAKKLEEKSDFTHYLGQDRDANEIKESDEFVVVVGYGVVGKLVCDLLDRKLIKYVGLEINPNKAIQARNKGLPVFYGDVGRQEVAEAFNVGKAKAVIVCIADRTQTNRAILALRRWYPDLKIFCRAVNMDHANYLQQTLDVVAMVPMLPEDNFLITLPFGGAVLKALGAEPAEVDAILEAKRKQLLSGRGLQENEQRVALMQLGVSVRDTTGVAAITTTSSGSSSGSSSSGSDDGDMIDLMSELEAAAAEHVEAIEARSPFVAHVIEEVCPGSVQDSGDNDDVNGRPVTSTNAEEKEKK